MKLNGGVSVAETGDGAIILNEKTGAMIHLNRSAYGCVRAALDKDADAATTWLQSTYQIDAERAHRDSAYVLQQLHDRGLLR